MRVSAVVDVSSANGRQQCRSNGWQRTLSSYGRLNPAGSGRQPSGMKHANQQSVARFNLRNRTNRRSRPCVGLERTVICTAPLKAWQTTERGLRQSRTPHARFSCIIGNFLTIAWGTETLAIGDSQVRSYDRRTVSVKWSVRRANCKRFTTNGRLTEPVQGQSTAVWSGALNGGARTDASRSTSVSSLFVKLRVFLGEAQNKTPQHKTPNCQPLRPSPP